MEELELGELDETTGEEALTLSPSPPDPLRLDFLWRATHTDTQSRAWFMGGPASQRSVNGSYL